MNISEIKKHISKMDVKSDEFWDLYQHIADKYFTLDQPDEFQGCAKVIMKWLEVCAGKMEEQVIIVAKVVEQVFKMRHGKTKSCTGTLGFKDETFFFDIYQTETEKDKLHDLLKDAGNKIESGNFTVKNKTKKNQFGKKYF